MPQTTKRSTRRCAAALLGLVGLAGAGAVPGPAAAQLFDPYLVGMMAGPVSDGPSVLLLKKREELFLSPDTLVIACGAGAASGVVAHALPALALAGTGIGAPAAVGALAGTSVFGCLVGAGAGAAAIGTQLTLNLLRSFHGGPPAAATAGPPAAPPAP